MSFGISTNIKSKTVQTCTVENFNQAIDSPKVAEICSQIAQAAEAHRKGEITTEAFEQLKSEKKKGLPVLTPHATFQNGRRLNEEAIPSGLSIYDIDHIDNPAARWSEIEGRKEELGIVLAHITPSTEGLRLVFVVPRGKSLEEAQRWLSTQLGDTDYDACVKDLARCSFVVPRAYILYVDEEGLFATRTVSEIQPEEAPVEEAPVEEPMPLEFKGIPYADIIQEWFNRMGGEPKMGERNDKLHRLASHLRYITDNDESVLFSIIPHYGLGDEEMRSLIQSACSAKFYSMPRVLKQIISQLASASTPEADSSEQTPFPYGKPVPPALPKRLPSLIKLLLSKTPDIYKPAVANAVFPALGTHLHKVGFRYIDNVKHEATLMNVLMAGTGAGKDCITEPINRIMADIRKTDKENLAREKAWKREMNSKGANKDKRERPEGLVIQEIDADMTNAAFVMRLAEAEEHFLYTKMNEIDQFDALRGSSKLGQQFQIMCLAFDPGSTYGQTRVGTQSVSERVQVRFNWNASTTIQKGKRYFSKVLTDGPLSRINFCTIPEREIGSDMPIYGTYDDAFDEELRPYIEHLTRAKGDIHCAEAFRLAKKLKEENAEYARISQDRVFENFSFRANVIAYLKACVLYVAQGCKWDKSIEDFVRWSLQYDLWCKMQFFGEAIESELKRADGDRSKTGRKCLLDQLPDEFTLEDLIRVRQLNGMNVQGTDQLIRQWKHRCYVTNVTCDKYIKAEKYRTQQRA